MDVETVIKPYVGVLFKGKEITFGMSQKEVEGILGKPVKYEVNNLIDLTWEPRDGATFFYGKSGLESIDIPLQETQKVYYENIDILHDKEAVIKLSQFDTPTADDGKFMNFYKLGICLGGFGKKRIPEKKLVTVFAKNQKEMFVMRYKTGGGRISHKVRKTLLLSNFTRGQYGYEAWTAMWGKEKVHVFVDMPDGDELSQWIGEVNKKLLWIDENRETLTRAVTDSNVFSGIHEWTSETVTAEDFRAGLYMSELGFSFQWKQAQIYIQCDRDYFSGHCICLYLDEQNKVTACGLEG